MTGTILMNEHNRNKKIMFKKLKESFQMSDFAMFSNYLRTENYNCDWVNENYREIYNTFLNYLKNEKNILIRTQLTDFLYCIEKNSPKQKSQNDKKLVLGKKNNNIYLYSTIANKCVNLSYFDSRYEHFIFRPYDTKSLCILYKFFVDTRDQICVLYNCSFLKNLSNSPQKKMLRKLCRARMNKCPTFFMCEKNEFGFLSDNNKRRIRSKLFVSIMNKQGAKGLRVDKNTFKDLNDIDLENYEVFPVCSSSST